MGERLPSARSTRRVTGPLAVEHPTPPAMLNSHDLDELSARAALRLKKAHEAFVKNKEKPRKDLQPGQSTQPTPPEFG